MTSVSETSKKNKTSKPKTNEEILLGFQKLRGEQRFLSIKLNELELELHEHRLVLRQAEVIVLLVCFICNKYAFKKKKKTKKKFLV